MNTYYLNNDGSRWKNIDRNGKSEKVSVFFPETGKTKKYAIAYIEAMGNFAVICAKIKGKIVQLMEFGPQLFLVNNVENRELKYR